MINKVLNNKKVQQSIILYGSLVLQLLMGIMISAINTRLLGPEQFGNYKYLQSVFLMASSLVAFGFFVTSGNMFGSECSGNKSEFLGGVSIVCAVLCVVYVAVVCIYLSMSEMFYSYDLFKYIKYVFPLLIVFQVRALFENLFRGDNRIFLLSLLKCMPVVLNLVFILLARCYYGYDIQKAIYCYLVSIFITVFGLAFTFRISFKGSLAVVRGVVARNWSLGLPVYCGVVITYVTTNLGNVSLGYFMNPEAIGSFSLAITIAMPLSMVPNVVATCYFKKFMFLDYIPVKLIVVTLVVSVLSLVVFNLLIYNVFLLVYGEEYNDVLSFVNYVAIGMLFHGVADFFSRFLLAKNKSKMLFIGSACFGLINVVGYFLLVYYFGILGAVATKVFASLFYLLITLFMYCSYTSCFRGNND